MGLNVSQGIPPSSFRSLCMRGNDSRFTGYDHRTVNAFRATVRHLRTEGKYCCVLLPMGSLYYSRRDDITSPLHRDNALTNYLHELQIFARCFFVPAENKAVTSSAREGVLAEVISHSYRLTYSTVQLFSFFCFLLTRQIVGHCRHSCSPTLIR